LQTTLSDFPPAAQCFAVDSTGIDAGLRLEHGEQRNPLGFRLISDESKLRCPTNGGSVARLIREIVDGASAVYSKAEHRDTN
jgi:hypothetical protein